MVEDEAGAAMLAEDDALPGGRHSERPAMAGKGSWLTARYPDINMAGKIISVVQYKGGVGKTLMAYELAYLLGGILLDLDWDRGNATRAWGYREEQRVGSPLLDAINRNRTPRPLAGGPWRPDLVPCTSDWGEFQPAADTMTDRLEDWAATWGEEYRCPVVVDTHPGGTITSTAGAVAAAHVVVVPVLLGEREMEATEGLVNELKSYQLLLIPNRVGVSPPERYIRWLQRIAATGFVPVGPPVSNYPKVSARSRRMAVCATDPAPAWARPLVAELHAVADKVVSHVAA